MQSVGVTLLGVEIKVKNYTIQVSIQGEQPVTLDIQARSKLHAHTKVSDKVTAPSGSKLQLRFI